MYGWIKGVSAGGYADITCKAGFGSEQDTVRVYCVEPIGKYVENSFTDLFTLIYAQPSVGSISALHFNRNILLQLWINIFMSLAQVGVVLPLPSSNSVYENNAQISSGVCEVRGKYNSYAYVVVGTNSGGADGFVKHTKLSKKMSSFLNLSATDIFVWGDGTVDSTKKLTTNYSGNISWSVGDSSIIHFDKATKQITGLKPGTTTITATADGMSETCTIHSLYKWPQTWSAKTNRDTDLYDADGSKYKVSKSMISGQGFTVYGDTGLSDGWAYGNIDGTNRCGFVPISHISTKGTVSQYRNLNWLWPVVTATGKNKANFISSPYGRRDLGSSSMHKGIDITTGTPGEIRGYEVVSSFEGEVTHISTNPNSSTGYCVSVRSFAVDPISGKKLVAIYMHLKEMPRVVRGQIVSSGDLLGYVGNTGSTSTGYHLHFEANNQNVSVGDGSTVRNYYANLINPLFFFTDYTNNYIIGTNADKKDNDEKIIIDKTSAAVARYYGAYWYGDDVEEK